MARKRTSSGFGIEVAKKFPAISNRIASEIAQERGLAADDPKVIAQAMSSRTFQERLKERAKGRDTKEARTAKRLAGQQIAQPSLSGSPQELQEQGELAEISSRERQSRLGGVLQGQVLDISAALRAADFNRDALKRKRLSELNPTGDIDDQITQLRNRALVSQAQLRQDIQGLSPSAQARVLAESSGTFTAAANRLTNLRNIRLKSAEEIVDQEIESRESEISDLEGQVDALDESMAIAKSRGIEERALSQLFIDRGKRLEKALKKKNGESTEEDIIFNKILNDVIEKGHTPTSADRTEARRQARQAVSQRKRVRGVFSRGGPSVAGITEENIEDVISPRGIPFE